jgi:glycosyltransferase involved in cell wall biosynthesis/GT2 family glycosyltransferase
MYKPFPTASIVINTLNRGRYLNDALLALKGIDYPEFEVIVVNGPSTDNSAEVIAGWGDGIKALECPLANLSMSRNIGIAAAAGDLICFMDDDAAPHPLWLRRLATVYRDPEVGAAGGFTIDNTGVHWQVRKTVCDRFGNAFNVSQYFDERPLNRPGTPYYPSLLGTNSSFRASALRGIGGFDETFAYLLDETDVCLRLVDGGWKVVYEPTALIYHQFAESHIRSDDRVARTLYPSARSKSYFIMNHGAKHDVQKAGMELERYREEIAQANQWLETNGNISASHRFSLDEDLYRGIAEGTQLAFAKGAQQAGDLPDGDPLPFRPFGLKNGGARRVALVSRGFPPSNETGIARWTKMVADGLAKRGHHVHVITESRSEFESVGFRNGIWIHELAASESAAAPFAERYDIPQSLAAWTGRVWREVQYLKSFGLDIASFPIWDLEGIALLDDPDIATVISLHTTYAMAKSFKQEWNVRPLYEHHFVNRVIAAERTLFERAPVLLANSQAIIDEIEAVYSVSIAERSPIVPHGTPDPLVELAGRCEARSAQMLAGAPLRVMYAGRFETRKGFDIAVQVANGLLAVNDVEIVFVGDRLDETHRQAIIAAGAGALLDNERVRFEGLLARAALDAAYVDADLVIMPSRFESFGLVAIEAMAAGRPVLALSSGGLAEVATEENGCTAFVENKDVASEFVAAITSLNAQRHVLAERGEKARKAFERHYSVEAMAMAIERVYELTLSGAVSKELEGVAGVD